MDVLSAVRAQEARLVGLRRQIHRDPELGWREHDTQALILRELEELGIPCESVCGTGVIAVLRGTKPGPVLGLRADMDALPIEEKNETEYRSRNPGVMHACGHDCHVAMLLTAARILSEHREELGGTVKFIFQPAEEIIEGGRKLSALPQLKDLDRIAALHVWNDVDVGCFSIEPGPRLACADNIFLTVRGKSAHGAKPHQATDAIVAACTVVEQLQTAVSRRIDPLEPAVVTIGTIRGGTQSNIIADTVEMSGTVRCFSPSLRDALSGMLEQIACSAAAVHGAACDFEYRRCTPPTINDGAVTELVRRSAVSLFGGQSLVHLEKTMGGEDFAWFLQNVPGCIAFVGGRNRAAGKYHPQHSDCFDIDERALTNGAALLVRLALDAGEN